MCDYLHLSAELERVSEVIELFLLHHGILLARLEKMGFRVYITDRV